MPFKRIEASSVVLLLILSSSLGLQWRSTEVISSLHYAEKRHEPIALVAVPAFLRPFISFDREGESEELERQEVVLPTAFFFFFRASFSKFVVMPTVLYRVPGSLTLPSVDPASLAIETMLRFASLNYTCGNSRIESVRLEVSDDSSTTAATPPPAQRRVEGTLPCLRYISSQMQQGDLSPAMEATATCVELLTLQFLFPAFLYLTHSNLPMYAAEMQRSVQPKVATFWEALCGSYRVHVLSRNPVAIQCRASGKAGATAAVEVMERVEKCMAALEKLCSASEPATRAAAAAADAEECFFLGTTRPTHVDALVYAAASSFFHADFSSGGPAGDASLESLQSSVLDACPSLLRYTERLRHMFFEAYSGTYSLKARLSEEEQNGASQRAMVDAMYRTGRLRTVCLTGIFAAIYFVLSNAGVIVELLEAAAADVEEDAALPNAEPEEKEE